MSTAKLNVWITNFGDACHIEDKELWFVHITDCHGRVLEWCGRNYSFLQANCGHLEVDVPPGCYAVFAGHSPKGAGVPPFGNRITHVQVVRANCGDHVCVTLFSPTMWYCGTWFAEAVHTQLPVLQAAKINIDLAQRAVDGVRDFLRELKPDTYGNNTLFALGGERLK
jgi:hypothetical protein